MKEHCKVCEEEYIEDYTNKMKDMENREKKKKRKKCHYYKSGNCHMGSNCVNIHEAPDLRGQLAGKKRKFK